MKNNFGKTTALIMGLLMILSGRALAFSSNNQESSHAETFGESKILIAQNAELSQEYFEAISQHAVQTSNTIGDLLAKLNSVPEADLLFKNDSAKILGQMQTVVETAVDNIDPQSFAKDDTEVAANAYFFVLNQVINGGNVTCGLLLSLAETEEGRAVAECCVRSFEDIAQKFESIAEAGL